MTTRLASEFSGPSPLARKRATPEPLRSPPSSPSKRTRACERCWKRKQKCDRKLPKCTNCQTSGLECLARVVAPRESFDDVALTHTSFQSYLESLERNVSNHDAHRNLSASADQTFSPDAAPKATTASPDHAPGPGPGDLRTRPVASPPLPANTHQPRSPSNEEDPSVGATMGAIGQLTNRAMAESRAGQDQSLGKLSLLHMVQAALDIDGHDPSSSTSKSLRPGDAENLTPCVLPARDEAVKYIRRYLSALHYIPCLVRVDETTLISNFDNVVAAATSEQQHGQARFVNRASPPADSNVDGSFEIYMQLAIGIMVSQDAVRSANYAQSLQLAATRLLPDVFSSGNYAQSVRSLLLLIAFSLVHPGGGSTWHLLGWAIRLCITAGFHKEPTSNSGLSSNEGDEARWIFWSVYIVDRWVAIAMDRPFGIQDGDISTQIPMDMSEDSTAKTSSDDNARSREALGLHIIRHAHITSNARTNSRASLMSHYGNLVIWRDADPPPMPSAAMMRSWEDNLNRLACRGLLQIALLIEGQRDQGGNRQARHDSMPASTVHEIQREAKEACSKFIKSTYGRGEQWPTTTPSFLDAYDLVFATVGYICLEVKQRQISSLTPRVQGHPNQAEMMGVVHKSSVMVTQIASRFPSLDGFHRLFLALYDKAVGETSGPIQAYPKALPSVLRRLIETTFQTVP